MLLSLRVQVRSGGAGAPDFWQESLMRNRCWAELVFLKSDVINQRGLRQFVVFTLECWTSFIQDMSYLVEHSWFMWVNSASAECSGCHMSIPSLEELLWWMLELHRQCVYVFLLSSCERTWWRLQVLASTFSSIPWVPVQVYSGPAALCRFTLARGSEVGFGLPPSWRLIHGFELRIEVIQCHWGDVSLSACGVMSYLQTLIHTSRVRELRWYFPCIYALCSL